MTKNATVPYFESDLQLRHMEQTGFRHAEPWGRWQLGQRATLTFTAPETQRIELVFRAYLPYKKQNVTLSLNGETIFSALRPSDPVGRLASQIPISLIAGRNTLEITTNKSNLNGSDPPFAENDRSDISIAINVLGFRPLQLRGKGVYGTQPSAFLNPGYISAGSQGLEILFGQQSGQLVNYSLLRRFEDQAFDFYLDGQHIYTLDARLPGHLLIGHFPIPSTSLPPSGLHVLRVSTQTSRQQRSNMDGPPILTTAEDGPDVQFYVQKLELQSTATLSDSPLFLPGIVLLTALLVGLLWRLLFKSQRTLP